MTEIINDSIPGRDVFHEAVWREVYEILSTPPTP
jgi:hypothetical protein